MTHQCHVHNRAHMRDAIATIKKPHQRPVHKCEDHLNIYLDNCDNLPHFEPEWMVIRGVGYGNVPTGVDSA